MIQHGKEFLTVEEAAQLYGFSRGTLYNFIHAKRIPYYKPGGRVLLKKSEIDSYIGSFRIPSISEPVEMRMV